MQFHLQGDPQTSVLHGWHSSKRACGAGFEGSFTNKAGPKQREGSATFFRRSRYRAVASRVVRLNDLVAAVLQADDPTSPHAQLLPILKSSQSLADHLQKVNPPPPRGCIVPFPAS